jgi:zinc protease
MYQINVRNLPFVLFLVVGFFLHTITPAYAQKIFNAKSATLDNGLQIVVVENHRVPVATQMLWYKVGAADELPGKSGIVHFLEHLMFKGHEYQGLGTYAPGEFSRIVRSIGGEDNAFTGQDYTAYHQSVAVEHLEEMMRIEAARIRGLNVPTEEVVSENKVIQEERRQRTDNNPSAQLAEKMNKALFPVHPYGIPVIGWMDEIQTLNWDDAKHFYDLFYTPNNAILVVSGDVTLPQVVDMAKRTYGLLPASKNTPSRIRKHTKKALPPHEPIIMKHENVREPMFKRIYRVPSLRQNIFMAINTSPALEVLEEIMGAPSTGRLYKSLVVEQKLAANIGLYYSSNSWDDGTLGISATPSSVDGVDALRTGIDKELRKMAENGPTPEEVTDAIKRLIDSSIFARDSLSAPAMIIGSNMVIGVPLEIIENWPEMISAVTADDIKMAAQIYLNPDKLTNTPPVEGILLPEDNNNEGKE